MRTLKHFQLALIIGLATLSQPSIAEIDNEHKIKAAIVYKILRFVTWPEEINNTNTIVLCVAAKDSFREAFEQIDGRQVGTRRVKLLDPAHLSDDVACAVEFTSLEDRASQLTNRSAGGHIPVLTISDGDEFAIRGGIINLVIRNNRVGFVINIAAAKKAGIKISSSLLQLADIVQHLPKKQTRKSVERDTEAGASS